MPKRKNAFTTPPPQAPTIDDKLKQGIGSLALEWIAKKPRQDLEAYTFNNLMEHGKTVLQKLKLTDQIKEQKDNVIIFTNCFTRIIININDKI